MELTQNLLKNFRLAKNFGQNSDVVNSIDYHSNGESLITGLLFVWISQNPSQFSVCTIT